MQGLVRRPGAVLTREQLMEAAYPDRTTVSDRTIDSHVKRIRRKFVAADPAFSRIEGVYRAGYKVRRHSGMTSRIGLRLLAFNLLVVFVPVIGVLYLDVYEAQLRQVQEAGLAQQARVLAATLGDRPVLDAGEIAKTFERLEHRSEARLRVYDLKGAAIADSVRETAAKASESRSPYASTDDHPGGDDVRQRVLYSVGVWLANSPERLAGVFDWLRGGQRKGYSADAPAAGPPPEVRAALDGRYGSATRVTGGQRSVTFFSAVPIRHDGAVTGAVVVSQSTRRMLLGLYDIRLRTFEIVVASLVAAAFLTALAAKTDRRAARPAPASGHRSGGTPRAAARRIVSRRQPAGRDRGAGARAG